MEKIIEIMDDISTNIEEAHEKIEKAFRMKEKCPYYAEWEAGMAATHLSFNTKGIETMDRMLDNWHRDSAHEGMHEGAGFKEFCAMWKGHIMKRTAKVRSMIEAFSI